MGTFFVITGWNLSRQGEELWEALKKATKIGEIYPNATITVSPGETTVKEYIEVDGLTIDGEIFDDPWFGDYELKFKAQPAQLPEVSHRYVESEKKAYRGYMSTRKKYK